MTPKIEPDPPVEFSVGYEDLKQRLNINKNVIIPQEFYDRLSDLGIRFDIKLQALAEHSRDWWPLSLQWAQKAMVPTFPGVVIYPTSTNEISKILKLDYEYVIPVTPAAGRSGVSGGVICIPGSISLDLTNVKEEFSVNEDSKTLTVSCGYFGPEVESKLQEDFALTLGHFPQSFDISTVGGWLACRSAGQLSNKYGKIEDMVLSLEVVLSDGSIIKTGTNAPKSAVGPDLNQLFVGSEGTLGIISKATFRVHSLPKYKRKAAFSAQSFANGLKVCQNIIQREANIAVLRLYDSVESERNFKLKDKNIIIVMDEGERFLVDANFSILLEECKDLEVLDEKLVDDWLENRNDVSGLGHFTKMGVCLDTIEISSDWTSLPLLYDEVVASLKAVEGTVNASAHQSHAYMSGACLYFTFAGISGENSGENFNETYYRLCWDAVMQTVEKYNGAISHHHGIGLNRSGYMKTALKESFSVLEGIKSQLDPKGILNPFKLGLKVEEIISELP